LVEKGKETDSNGVEEHAELEILSMDIKGKESNLVKKMATRG